jgi:hypothetical protein
MHSLTERSVHRIDGVIGPIWLADLAGRTRWQPEGTILIKCGSFHRTPTTPES